MEGNVSNMGNFDSNFFSMEMPTNQKKHRLIVAIKKGVMVSILVGLVSDQSGQMKDILRINLGCG